MDCPVTTTTSSFILKTPEGKIVRFDPSSNTKFIEVVKSNNDWSREVHEKAPIIVKIVGMPNGDFFLVKSIKQHHTWFE